jgi:hypothetical protein
MHATPHLHMRCTVGLRICEDLSSGPDARTKTVVYCKLIAPNPPSLEFGYVETTGDPYKVPMNPFLEIDRVPLGIPKKE